MTLIVSLPSRPRAGDPAAAWWRIADGAIVASGDDGGWTDLFAGDRPPQVIALAPAADVRLSRLPRESAVPRQAAAVAAVQAVAASLGDPATLHAAAALPDGDSAHVDVAVVANGTMTQWLDWMAAAGADPDAIVPAVLLLPRDGDGWHRAAVGAETILVRDDMAMIDEPPWTDTLVGDAPVTDVPADHVRAAIAALPDGVPINLRSGRFARRRRFRVDKARLAQLAVLIALIPLISLLIALASLAKLWIATSELNRSAAAEVSALAGRSLTIADAEAELETLAARTPGAAGSLSAPLSALWLRLPSGNGASLVQLGWRRDGTLSATLAAARAEPINAVLVALQRDGYVVTAVPRQGTDGRTFADVTIRSVE